MAQQHIVLIAPVIHSVERQRQTLLHFVVNQFFSNISQKPALMGRFLLCIVILLTETVCPHCYMYIMNNNRGITSVKLMTIIVSLVIFGIISYIIFYPFLGLSQQTSDTNVKKMFVAMKSQAELYYLLAGNSSYGRAVPDGTLCIHAVNIPYTVFSGTTSLRDLIRFVNIDGAFGLTCASSPTSWTVVGTLPSEASNWCVDNQGNSKAVSTSSVATVSGC